ncbi:MAG: metal-sensing transcriptional repressor [Bacilli bacterium]|nr:metal-sensing transcriptional repressor [Bacilli bacterium]
MDRKDIKQLLSIVKGQLNGIDKMLDDGVYCIDISNQLLASIALLKKANVILLDQHLKHCVLNANSREEREEKLEEISKVISKVM